MTRDYELDLDGQTGEAPLLTVWGGKITTFRKLAEESVDLLAARLGTRQPGWTREATLPGGDLHSWIGSSQQPDVDFQRFIKLLARRYPDIPEGLRLRLARCYGTRIDLLITRGGLGPEVAPGLHEGELNYLYEHEWARTAEDVLWRRTKLGIHMDATARAAVDKWCQQTWSPNKIFSLEGKGLPPFII